MEDGAGAPLSRRLRDRGHEVHAPTLTGLGERAQLLSRDITLSTHVENVLRLLETEEIEDAVLVSHSYGGIVATAVADRCPARFKALVYLDAFVPADGDSLLGLNDTKFRNAILDSVEDGWRVPPFSAAALGVERTKDRAWVDRLCSDHPLRTLQDRVRLTNAFMTVPARLLCPALGTASTSFLAQAGRLHNAGWAMIPIAGGHDLMIDRPDEVASVLIACATE